MNGPEFAGPFFIPDARIWLPRGTQMTSNPSSLLGRATEWRQLAEAIDAVRRGSFRAVFIHGEAGIGKTRLIQELVAHTEQAGFTVFSGRPEDRERMRPFGAIADGMARFARQLGPGGATLQDFVKQLSTSLNPVEVTDRFVEMIEELAVSQPTCVVLEDLHWADPETITAFRALNRRLGYLPILVAGTYRPHPQSPELARFVDAAFGEGSTVVELGRLDDDAVVALVGRIVGGAVGPRLVKMLEAASGNPFFAAELARALQEAEALKVEGDVVDADVAELPPTLRLTILRRLSQFPSDVVELLKSAAILGSSFHLHELAVVTAQPVADVARALEGPIAAKMIEERDARLAFRHDLIHEAIYQDIPMPIRAAMHVDIARVLRSLGVPPVRIAEHMIRGLDLGDPKLFDEAFALAVELRNSTPLVNLALAEKALTMAGVSEQRRDELRRHMIYPLVIIGRRGDAERLAKEVLMRPQDPAIEGMLRVIVAVARSEDGRNQESLGEFERLAAHPHLPPPIRRVVSLAHAAVLMRAGYFDSIVSIGEQVLAESRASDDAVSLGPATVVLAGGRLGEGHVAEAVRLTEQFIEMDARNRSFIPTPLMSTAVSYLTADRLGDARRACQEGSQRASETGELPGLAVYAGMEGFVCFVSGAWDEGLAQAKRAHELVAEGRGASMSLIQAYAVMAQIALRRGSIDRALSWVEAAERMIADKGPQWAPELIAWTKALYVEASGGDSAAALKAFVVGWDAGASGRYLFGRPTFPDLVRLAVAAGDRQGAIHVTEEAEEGRRRASEVPSVVGCALRCRGILEDDADLLVSAVDAYRQSPRVVETAGAGDDAARCLARRGNTSDARSLFEEALATFEKLGAIHDSSRVLAAMRSAGMRRGSRAPRRHAVSGWDALTPTEVEVARLTVEGLTNPKIAERLYVSKYTVQTHLSHIFGKLQVSSRAELAVVAAKHQT